MNILNFCKRPSWVLALVTLTLYVSSAQAHLKWFVEDSQQTHIYNNLILYSLTWISIGVVLILAGILIDRIFPKVSESWQPKFIEKYATSVLGILVGVSLIISALDGNLFSMNINGSGALHTTLLLVEGFIGISLVLGLAVRQASILLIALWLVVSQVSGLAVTLENLWIPGAAIFFLLRGRPMLRYSREDVFSLSSVTINQAQALTFLRVFIGANLIFLGFSEKIVVPELGLAFLQEHPWNFMQQHLGVFWFTDELFVFSAGAVEIILGLFLVAGWAVRLTAATLAILFLTPPFFMGPAEMIGHIPHISIVVMLLLFGRGCTLKVALTSLSGIPKYTQPSHQPLLTDTLHSSLPSPANYNVRSRYKRTVNMGKNHDLHHGANVSMKQHSSISRLSKNRYRPLKENLIQLMT
ncbi:MAG: hypothetical protein GXP14_05990 [Gammaproteobacteria bacterium]|nr:hypothetical protein [Gammaproteobacteria bacterium]